MKPQKDKKNQEDIFKGFTIEPGLNEKYANQPFFIEKAEKANKMLENSVLPDFNKKRKEN
jgi:hypothetical protein